MYRFFQEFGDDEVTFKKNEDLRYKGEVTFPVTRNGKPTLIFMEDQLRHCKCGVGVYWTGDAGTECRRNLKEIKKRRRPWSRSYYCDEGKMYITVIRNSDKDRRKKGYMAMYEGFNDDELEEGRCWNWYTIQS